MKYKYAAAFVAVVVTTVTLVAMAEKQASAGKVYLLKAGGKTIAELRVRGTAIVGFEGANSASHINYYQDTETFVATGGAILHLTVGTNSVSARADEIESVPDSK